jgi:hypothetical protein
VDGVGLYRTSQYNFPVDPVLYGRTEFDLDKSSIHKLIDAGAGKPASQIELT